MGNLLFNEMMMSRGECVRIISIWTWLTRDLKVVEVGEDITKCPKNKITFFSYQIKDVSRENDKL